MAVFTLAVRGRKTARAWIKSEQSAAAGKTLSAHEAGRFLPHKRAGSVRYDADEETRSLTVREEEVLTLLADNKNNSEISALAGIAIGTVEKHIEHIYPKLRVNSRAEAAIWYLRREIEALKLEVAELRQLLAGQK